MAEHPRAEHPKAEQAKKPGYRDTLNMPETAFPMKAELAKREPDRLAAWTAAKK